MPSLKAAERQKLILSSLKDEGRVSIDKLVDEIGVSAVTIRSDLAQLEQSHVLRRIRGGAIAAFPSRQDSADQLALPAHSKEKEKIVEAAASMIHDGETVFLSSGPMPELLASRVPDNMTDLVVVTNSINVARILADHDGVTVIVTGGTLRPKGSSLVAPLGDVLLQEINADLALLGASGVHESRGFTSSSWAEAEVAKEMARAAKRVVFMADYTRINHIASARIVELERVDALVTDKSAPADFLRVARKKGIEVITV